MTDYLILAKVNRIYDSINYFLKTPSLMDLSYYNYVNDCKVTAIEDKIKILP